MIHTHAFRLAWDDSVDQFKDNLPWAMIALCIVVATCIAVFLIVYFGSCCCRSKSRLARIHYKNFGSWGQTMGRVVLIVIAAIVAAGGFWIAATTFGVSFWNIIFSYGIAALLISQIFGVALQNLGAFVQIVFSGKIAMDIYVKFLRTPMEGRVTAMNISWFELEHVTQDGGVVFFYVPTREFIASPYAVREEHMPPRPVKSGFKLR